MPKVTLTLSTDKLLEGIVLSKEKLKTLLEDMEQSTGSFEFQDSNNHEVVLAVQHIISVQVLDQE